MGSPTSQTARQFTNRLQDAGAQRPGYRDIGTAEERKAAVKLIQYLSGTQGCADQRVRRLAAAVEAWDVKRAQQARSG